jgi:hypothetical protein
MRSTLPPLGATGPGKWFPLDTGQSGYGVGYFCNVQQGSTLTYKIQHGFYDPWVDQYAPLSITRSSTTATVTFPTAVTPKVGDVLVVISGGSPFDGTFDIASVVSGSQVTYTVPASGLTTAGAGAQVLIIRTEDDPIVVSQTSSTSGNIAFPTNAIRLNVTAYTSGAVSLTVNQGISA